MDQGFHTFLVWLLSLEFDPFSIPILSLILLPFKVSDLATNWKVEWKSAIPVGIGVFSGVFLYAPTVLSNVLPTNATELSVLSSGVAATGLWYFGGSVVDMLGLEIVALLTIIKTTGTTQEWVRNLTKLCGGLMVALVVLYLGVRLGRI
jgi:hypothetical protein